MKSNLSASISKFGSLGHIHYIIFYVVSDKYFRKKLSYIHVDRIVVSKEKILYSLMGPRKDQFSRDIYFEAHLSYIFTAY